MYNVPKNVLSYNLCLNLLQDIVQVISGFRIAQYNASSVCIPVIQHDHS